MRAPQLVTAAQQGGKVLGVKLEPTMAGTISLKNPWGQGPVKVSRGDRSEALSGEILTLPIRPWEVIRLSP